MGKKDKKIVEDATSAVNPASKETKKAGIDGGLTFNSSDANIEAAQKKVDLSHTSKAWRRAAWERARPWVLEQRQKLETNGWTSVDCLRTELFVLKKPAPAGFYSDDGYIYIRIPKKFIDFNRSGKGSNGEEGTTDKGEDGTEKKKKKTSRLAKKREGAASYELKDELVWKVKIDGANSEEVGREPNVCLDVMEPMENILYLVMCLQPGLVTLHANRKDVVQQGTKQSTFRDDAENPSVRHTAMVASSESYTRTLPPVFWFKRHGEHLRKILSATGNAEISKEYDDTAEAADNVQRAVTRDVKDVKEKSWEEELPANAKGPKGKEGGAAAPLKMKSKKTAPKQAVAAVAAAA